MKKIKQYSISEKTIDTIDELSFIEKRNKSIIIELAIEYYKDNVHNTKVA